MLSYRSLSESWRVMSAYKLRNRSEIVARQAILKKLLNLSRFKKDLVRMVMMMNCTSKLWSLLLSQEEHLFLRYKGSLELAITEPHD